MSRHWRHAYAPLLNLRLIGCGEFALTLNNRLDWKGLFPKLWPNQVAALQILNRYLRKTTGLGALVHMPTGTGKTAIIAVVARACAVGKAVVIVSPSKALAGQLRLDVGSLVWQRLGIGAPWAPFKIVDLLRSNEAELVAAIKRAKETPTALVGTIQALHDIRVSAPALFETIRKNIDLSVVDEGHREPAPEWSQSVEALKVPSVLFSATPYRNDVRAFNIDTTCISYQSFDWAIENGLIRDVQFETLDGAGDAASFARNAVARFQELLDDGVVRADAKAILRFSRFATLAAAVDALEHDETAHELGFVAVHDRFVGDEGVRCHAIADLRGRPERLFLHQFKLTEGIDEPRCSVLFLHEDFGNERQLVQQVGRIVRRCDPRGAAEPNALVVTLPKARAASSWQIYREFDRACALMKKPPIFDAIEYGRRLRELDVPAEYGDKRFRMAPPATIHELEPGADPPSDDAHRAFVQDVLPQRRCVVYKVDEGSTFEENVAHWRAVLEKGTRSLIASSDPFPEDIPLLHVFVCHVMEHSDLFERFSLMENHYTITVLYRHANRLFVYDSSGMTEPGAERASYRELGLLLPERNGTVIKMFAAKNTDLAPYAIRARTMSGASLANSAPFLGDFLNIVTRASGRVTTGNGGVGRYVGFVNGRVTDARGGRVNLEEFTLWCQSIEQDLDNTGTTAAFFNRFAQRVDAPVSPTPLNILLDITAFDVEFVHVTTREPLPALDDFCVSVAQNNTGRNPEFAFMFDVVSEPDQNNHREAYRCYLKYDDVTRRFRLRSDDLGRFVSSGEDTPISLADAIDREQSFRIILSQHGVAYAYGEFFDVSPSRPGMLQMINALLISDPRLAGVTSEKGDTPGNGQVWNPGSLFALIDNSTAGFAMRGFSGDWQTLICDDIGQELADFIAYRLNPPAIAFIHAKHKSSGSKVSASALHDVLAQAIKNLDFIRLAGSAIPSGKAAFWNGPWISPIPNYRVDDRIRTGGLGAQHVRNIKALLSQATTERHVCVVLSNALDKAALLRQLSRTPTVVASQAFLQLVAFYSQAASVSVTPTIICD